MGNEAAWELESGLLDNFDFTIERSYFATDPRYQGGTAWLLHWEGTATTEDDEEIPHTIMIGLGSGWTSTDGGESVTHESGKSKFNQNSRYGRIIGRCVNPKTEKYMGDEIRKVMFDRGTPTSAAVWEGLRFHIDREEVDFGKDIGTREWELPTEYLGQGGEDKKPVVEKKEAAGTNGTGNKVMLAKLRKLAKESDTHDEFVDKALELDDVTGDEELLALVTDENAIYADAR